MVEARRTRLMTAEELFEMPDDGNLYELVEGVLTQVSPASQTSSAVAGIILTLLNNHVRPKKLGLVTGADGGAKLRSNPDTVRAPDVAFVRADRLPQGRPARSFFDGAPDLAVEVFSPSDRRSVTLRTMQSYLDAGVRLAWFIDPFERSAQVYRPGQPARGLAEDGVLDGDDVLPGFRLPLEDIWL